MGTPMGGAPAGMPGMGMPPPPGMPPMGGAAPTIQPLSGAPDRLEITAPINTLGKILYDADVTEMVENELGDSVQEMASHIWQMYGGNEHGEVDPDKAGRRQKKTLEGPEAEEEKMATDDSRWERLPLGKTIADITSLEEIERVMNGLILGTVQATKQQEGGQAGAAPPMMASTQENNVRLAILTELDTIIEEISEKSDFEKESAVLHDMFIRIATV
jgi:hypothetical protein